MSVSTETFSECIAKFYAAALAPEQLDPALECFARTLDTSAAAVVDAAADGTKAIQAGFGFSPEAIAAYNDRYQAFDRAVPARNGAPEIFNVYLADSRWPGYGSSSFRNEWAVPNDAQQIASISVDGPGETRRSLILVAGRADRRFGDPDQLAFLRLLRPHLQRVSDISAQMRRAERFGSQFLDVLEHLTSGAIVIDRQARVTHATAAALELIRGGEGLRLTSRGLRATDLETDRRLRAVIAGALGRAAEVARALPVGAPIRVPRPGMAFPLIVTVVALSAGRTNPALDDNAALILLSDPARRLARESDLLTGLFQLTRAEAAVALRVAEGQGLAAVAAQLGVSIATVRTHLTRIFDKTDTHRQAQLVRLIEGVYAATGTI